MYFCVPLADRLCTDKEIANFYSPIICGKGHSYPFALFLKKISTMKIEVGQQAPAFSLYDSDKNKVSLSDFSGKNVVLLFFPLAFTSVCTAELCSVRDNLSMYSQLNAEVLGISVDSLHTLKRFKQDQQLNFRLLSDFNKDVSTAYGSIYDNFSFDMKGVSKRAAFLIDEKGIVRYAEVLENAGSQPNFQALQNALELVKS
jgi:peroxiredoxin